MKKIIYMSQFMNDATAYYRLIPLDYIQHPDFTIERKPYNGDITFSSLLGYDVLILERPSSSHDLTLIKLAKACGLKIVTDFDDDILHVDEYNPMYPHYHDAKGVILECIGLSDEVWVSTQGIKNSFKWYNKNIQILPNCHNDFVHPISKKRPFNHQTKTAFWRGGGSHEADVYHHAQELLDIITYNVDWFFQFMGHRFIYLEQRCGDNYLPVSGRPLMNYFDYMYEGNPNVVFHPLCTTLFNKSKSSISWLESSYVGAAFFGNKELPEMEKPCILNFKHLGTELLADMKSLEIANQVSWEMICDEYLLSKVNEVRKERLLSI